MTRAGKKNLLPILHSFAEKWIYTILLLFCFVYRASSQQANPDLQLLIDTENAFAGKASETSIPVAFLANLDSSGVVFNGGKVVNGVRHYSQAPADAKDLLSWYPIVAHVATSGELGFTSGPYQYFAEKGGNAVSSGYFLSIWKKDSIDRFKLLLDGGVVHSRNHAEAFKKDPKLENADYDYLKSVTVGTDAIFDPWQAEEAFSQSALKNPVNAYHQFLGNTSFVLRNDGPLTRGKISNLRIIGQQNIKSYQFIKSGQGMSNAGDLAYCYGEVKTTGNNAQASGQGVFVRIWQRQSGGWKIVAEQVTLLP